MPAVMRSALVVRVAGLSGVFVLIPALIFLSGTRRSGPWWERPSSSGCRRAGRGPSRRRRWRGLGAGRGVPQGWRDSKRVIDEVANAARHESTVHPSGAEEAEIVTASEPV